MVPEIAVRKLTDGLGYGEGPIDGDSLKAEAGSAVTAAAEAVITSPAVLVAVDRDAEGKVVDDDGCGDGRKVKRIFQGVIEKSRSLARSKVFGGGAAMAAATMIGTGQTAGRGLNQLFGAAIGTLRRNGINFGAHTADHVANPDTDSGCGAIDNAPAIVAAAAVHAADIRRSLAALGVDGGPAVEDVLANFAAYGRAIAGQPYTGKAVMQEIIDDGKIVKQLEGKHLEGYIVLNFVAGHTVNQQAVREASGGQLDVFAVDVWRLQQYAAELFPDDPAAQQQAFISELVYTLATASVLTKGNLPVYVVEAAPVPAAVS